MAISAQWAELLEPGLRAIFNTQRDALVAESRIPALYNVVRSTKAQEHDLGMGGFGDWAQYAGRIEYDENDQLYKTTYTHVEYVRGFKVERRLVDDDQYNVINKRPSGLALSAVRTREKHAASVFNNAFSSSYTGADGKPLCDAAHPLSPETGAGTHGNLGSTALDYDAVIATRKLMRSYVDDRGELIPVNPNTILVPLELEDTAWEIANTINKPGTADNDGNFVRSTGLRVIVWDYLTDENNWFMLDPALAKMYLNWFDRVPLEFSMDPTSDFNLEAKFRGYMRYSYGFSDWRWVYGHQVS
jgi:phage major head subunit gpT-like protein